MSSAPRRPSLDELLILARDLTAAKTGRWDQVPAVTYLTSPSMPPRRHPVPELLTDTGELATLRTIADVLAPVQQDLELYAAPLAVLTCPTDVGGLLLKVYVRGKAPRCFHFTATDLQQVDPQNAQTWAFFEIKNDPLPVDLYSVQRKTVAA